MAKNSKTIAFVSLILFLGSCASAQDEPEIEQPNLAAALDWYRIWHSQSNANQTQGCQGEASSNVVVFRCDPLAVVVDIRLDESGCSISFMRPAWDARDGAEIRLADVPRNEAPILSSCGDLQLTSRWLEFEVEPRKRPIDIELTNVARAAASRYFSDPTWEGCEVRFPLIRRGDPFFHVYVSCDSTLINVDEFTLEGNVPSTFPHWTYYRSKGDLPKGADGRVNNEALWVGESIIP